MSDLKLVSPDQPTPFEQRLLEAVANESPSAEQRARVRLALGLPALAAPPTAVAAESHRALLFKAAAGGLVVVSAALIVWFAGIGRKPSATEAPARVPLTQQDDRAPAVNVPAVSAPAVSAPEPAVSSTRALARNDGAPSKRPSKASTVENGADLGEQLRLIDAARSAVAAGNASAASAALSTYRSRFPRGPFGQEAAVLQIQTLDLQGNHAQATSLARAFLARHPNSPHVGVVQRIAGANR